MSVAGQLPNRERETLSLVRTLANQAFSRAAGAPLIPRNSIRLLKDAGENYPAWLDAIRAAKHHVYFESYVLHEDDAGRMFAAALVAKAQEGVRVRLLYDWLGGFGPASRAFWNRLRAGGVEVRGRIDLKRWLREMGFAAIFFLNAYERRDHLRYRRKLSAP